MSKLKPCPFCGGQAVNEQDGHPIYCGSCYSSMPYGICENDMVTLWNTRVDKWVNVENNLPEIGQRCLIEIPVCDSFNVENGTYKGNGVWVGAWCDSRGLNCPYKVSRWTPI